MISYNFKKRRTETRLPIKPTPDPRPRMMSDKFRINGFGFNNSNILIVAMLPLVV